MSEKLLFNFFSLAGEFDHFQLTRGCDWTTKSSGKKYNVKTIDYY